MGLTRTDAVKDVLTANTQLFADRGAFGVPALYVAGQLFWGNDRVHFVQHALGAPKVKYPPPRIAESATNANPKPKVKFYFDFSSPWAYVGHTQYKAFTAAADVELVPILLGALFKEIGTPMLPMMAMAEAKRAYMAADLRRWCEWWGIELNWPSSFPLRTVAALRIALVEPRVSDALFRAAWVDNLNIGDAAVLRRVLIDAGFDADALAMRANATAIKERLTANTAAAAARGVCGVPTFEVHGSLLWGQDRLELLHEMIAEPARFARAERRPAAARL